MNYTFMWDIPPKSILVFLITELFKKLKFSEWVVHNRDPLRGQPIFLFDFLWNNSREMQFLMSNYFFKGFWWQGLLPLGVANAWTTYSKRQSDKQYLYCSSSIGQYVCHVLCVSWSTGRNRHFRKFFGHHTVANVYLLDKNSESAVSCQNIFF